MDTKLVLLLLEFLRYYLIVYKFKFMLNLNVTRFGKSTISPGINNRDTGKKLSLGAVGCVYASYQQL